MALKTTYKDDVLNTSKNDKRKYNMIQNSDGTVSLEDVTAYTQVGDSFGAADINTTNKKVNEIDSSLSDKVSGFTSDTYEAVTGLAYDPTNKKLGLKVGADTVIPFNGDGGLLYAFGKNNGCSFIKGGNSSGVITEASDNVNVYCSSNDNTAINIPIDVSEINEIILIFGVNGQVLVGLSSTVSYAPDIQRTQHSGTSMKKHSIDTSSLTGNYYINISAWAGGKGTIYEILVR